MPRIALLNANTTGSITARMAAHARDWLGEEWRVEGLTAPFGEPYIADRAASAAAAHAVVEMARSLAAAPPDVAVVACFGDPGLWAARALLPCPVAGMAEASLHAACQIGRRVGIVTGGAGWKPMLEEFVGLCGLAMRLAGVRVLAPTGAAIATDPDAALAALEGAVAAAAVEDGADVVILGGAGLVGLSRRIRSPVPVIDSLEASLAQAAALARLAMDRSGG